MVYTSCEEKEKKVFTFGFIGISNCQQFTTVNRSLFTKNVHKKKPPQQGGFTTTEGYHTRK